MLGSAKKREPPAPGEARPGSLGPVAEGVLFARMAEVGLVFWVAPQELERELCRAQVGKVVVSG
jgi:hypothetical protein